MVGLRGTCEDHTTTVNGRQEYHGKGSCGAARHCFKNLNGPEEDLGTSISWNSEDDLDEKRMRARKGDDSMGHTPAYTLPSMSLLWSSTARADIN